MVLAFAVAGGCAKPTISSTRGATTTTPAAKPTVAPAPASTVESAADSTDSAKLPAENATPNTSTATTEKSSQPAEQPAEDDSKIPVASPPLDADTQLAQADAPPKTAADDTETPVKNDNPFAHRIAVPDFPKDADWLNTAGPLRKQDLKGKFVILDFWTYCCINCMHILPELKKLEHAYPKELVVIGVHSAKFDTEKDSRNIEDAILRYEIEHPVVNDAGHEIWNTYGVSSWPTVLLIDPLGYAIWGRSGEITFDDVNEVLKIAIPYYRDKGALDESPIRFDLLANRQTPTALRFPGKVLADEAGDRLFITDSNHNRIVVTKLDGTLLEIIGSGAIGRADGSYTEASFDHPQGLALYGSTLYVADTENHLLRKIDLEEKTVTTIAGTGQQARSAWPGLEKLTRLDPLPERWVGPTQATGLNSPWALYVHKDNLYIAMAGPHQIWKMPLDESEIGPYAGNGREDIVDGPLLPKQPYELGYSSFAQPSGLTSDGTWLYVADSEGSSIRAVPFDPSQEVRTVVGTAALPYARLFTFGDQDGDRRQARLQHVLGVSYHDGKIYAADTYNNKLKIVDAETGAVRTLAGTGEPGLQDEPAQFDEPAGLSFARGKLYVADTNNHVIRVVDVASGKVQTLQIAGLTPPAKQAAQSGLQLVGTDEVKVNEAKLKPLDGKIELVVELKLPEGWKINELAPMKYKVEFPADEGLIARDQAGTKSLAKPTKSFTVPLNAAGSGSDVVKLGFNYFYCQEGNEGVCKIGSVTFQVPVTLSDEGTTHQVKLVRVAEE